MLFGLPSRWDACSRTISLQGRPSAIAYRGDIIAVGLGSNVELLDAITGARTSALHGHTATITSLVFSLDGTLLISRSYDNAVKLWDIQTGGAIRTFSDRTCTVTAASISPDCTTIALGTTDGSIHSWDVRTGKLRLIVKPRPSEVEFISFFPTNNSQRLTWSSASKNLQQLNLDGSQIRNYQPEEYVVRDFAYASDETRFVSCGSQGATVRDSASGSVVVKLGEQSLSQCCFSPNGKFVACSGGITIYVWDITSPARARLVEKFVGHSEHITFLAFPSSLISGSWDQSVKFWQCSSFQGTSKTGRTAARPLFGSTPISSVKLFAKDTTIVTSDESGVVKTWDLMTGAFKSSFHTPAEGPRDTHLEGNTLIIVWRTNHNTQHQYHVWDACKKCPLQTFSRPFVDIKHLKISGDGSMMFGLGPSHIEAVTVETGKARRVKLRGGRASNFFVHGSRVGVGHSLRRGWDFGDPKVPELGEFPDRPRLDLLGRPRGKGFESRWVEDTVTKRTVFHLPDKYSKPDMTVEWDGRYLLIWSKSGEVVVIDFENVLYSLDRIR